MRIIVLLLMILMPSLSFANSSINELDHIIIDPAHGGNDPGAIGLNNTQEKDVTLNFSMMLKSKIEKQSGYKVKLTRDQDKTIKRNLDSKALVFIIHAGADQDNSVHGVSVTANPKLISAEKIKNSFLSNGINVNVIEKENEPLNYILVEIGYITNKDDITLLNSEAYSVNIVKSFSAITAEIMGK